jgi:glycerophosphoryl diester phosphodiesterase
MKKRHKIIVAIIIAVTIISASLLIREGYFVGRGGAADPATPAGTTGAAGTVWPEESGEKQEGRRPVLIAHRGFPQKEPENSLTGFKAAVSQGAIFIEPDLVISSDGVLYVSHDDNLLRTTGRKLDVSRTVSEELDKVRLRNGENLPRLDALFDALGDKPFYVLETKAVVGGLDRLMDCELIRLVKKYRLEKRILLQSQSMTSLRTVHETFRSIPYMYIMTRRSVNDDPVRKIRSLPAWIGAISISRAMATARIIRAAHRRGVKIALYTVRNKRGMEEALRRSPDMLFTDNIRMSLKYLSGTRWR